MRNVVNDDDRLYISKFICSVSDFACDGYEKFYNHMLIMHKKHIFCCRCPDCFKWFESLTPDKLEYHQSTHNQVKRFGFEPCGKVFTTVYDEGRHKIYNCPNNPDRVFKCKHCIAKGLADPDVEGAESGLMNHLTAEHGIAGVYLCLYCHKLFVTNAKLSKHNKTCSKNHPDKHG